MTKPIISLLVYQIGPDGASNVLIPPSPRGFVVRNMTEGPISTWQGDMSNPLDPMASGVDPSIRYKVYSYIDYTRPSQSAVERFYFNSTVDDIVNLINS